MQLDDKTAIVTGCSRGIGLAVANLLAENGAFIVANGRKLGELEAATAHLPSCLSITADVTDPRQAGNLISRTLEFRKNIDILVCNVGSGASAPPGNETVEEWHKMFAINFYSAVNVIESAKPFLKNGANIVCISSICGNEAIPNAPITYSTAKSALNNYVNLASRYFGKLGIRINAVAPGNVIFEGSVWDEKMRKCPEKVKKIIETEVPLSKFAQPSDVAETVLWLVTEKSKFVNGSIFTVDGGQTRSI